MKKNDLLDISTFKKLWKEREENKAFLKLLSYLQIDSQNTTLIESEKYIILYQQQEDEYIIFISQTHPIKEDFLEEKERLQIKKQRFIFLEDK